MAKLRYTSDAFICPGEERVQRASYALQGLMSFPPVPEHAEFHVSVTPAEMPNHVKIYAYVDVEE